MKQIIVPSSRKKIWESRSRLVNSPDINIDSLSVIDLKEELMAIKDEIGAINEQIREYQISKNEFKSVNDNDWFLRASQAKAIRGRIQQKIQARMGIIKNQDREATNKVMGLTEQDWDGFHKVLSWMRKQSSQYRLTKEKE